MKINLDAADLWAKINAPMSLQEIYLLESVRNLKEGEEWKSKDLPKVRTKPVHYLGDLISLPPPLISARYYLERKESQYSIKINVESKQNPDGVREDFAQRLKDKWVDLSDTNFVTGYVCLDNQSVCSIQLDKDWFTPHYYVCIGGNGAKQLKITDETTFEEFEENVDVLEQTTNVLINSILDTSVRNGLIRENPKNLELYLL